MLLDMETLFSDAQAITATAASTNVVLMAKGPLKEVSFGTPMPLLIQVVEDFATCTSVTFAVETSATENFASATTLATTAAIPLAQLKAGYKAPINFIPKGNLGYMRVKYTVAGSNATAGKVTAGIVAAVDGGFQDM